MTYTQKKRAPLVLAFGLGPLLVLPTGCDGMLDVRVQVQRICVSALDEDFAGAKSFPTLPIPGASNTPVTMDFNKPLVQIPGKAAGLPLALDARVDEVVIRSKHDLSFIRRMKVTLEPGDPAEGMAAPDLVPKVLGQFTRELGTTGEIHEIRLASQLNENVFSYLVGAPANLRFGLTARKPSDNFRADVEACIFVQGRKTYP